MGVRLLSLATAGWIVAVLFAMVTNDSRLIVGLLAGLTIVAFAAAAVLIVYATWTDERP